jgi:hypothetical protein
VKCDRDKSADAVSNELVLQITGVRTSEGEQVTTAPSAGKKLRLELKAVRLTASIVGVFLVLWMTFIIGRMILVSGVHPLLGQYVSDVGIALGVLNSSINWIIYGLASRDFRRAVVKMLML